MLEGKGRLSRRKDGKHFLYLPKSVVGDSAFPFKLESSLPVWAVINPKGGRVLILPLNRAKKRPKKSD